MRKILVTTLMIFSILLLATSVSASTLFCLNDGQTIEFSRCNSNIADRTCTSTTCQFCVTEISPGVYCPASLNSCESQCIPFEESDNSNDNNDNNSTNNDNNNTNNDNNNTNNDNNNTDNNSDSSINLLAPNNNHIEDNETEIEFEFDVESSFEIDFCELVLNDEAVATSSSRIQSSSNTINHLVAPGNYDWRIDCTPRDGGSTRSSESRTLSVAGDGGVIDTPEINVELLSPEDNLLIIGGSQEVAFNFNLSDLTNVAYCNFLLNNDVSANTTEVDTTTEINATILNGQHVWGIECFDTENNSFLSETRSLTINTPAPTSSSGSSGGGGGGGSSSSSDDDCCYAAVQKRLEREAAAASNETDDELDLELLANDEGVAEEEVEQTGFSRITGAVVGASQNLGDRNTIGLAILILAALGASGYMAYRNMPVNSKGKKK